MKYIADGPDIWLIDGEVRKWIGRVDPKIAKQIVRLLNNCGSIKTRLI